MTSQLPTFPLALLCCLQRSEAEIKTEYSHQYWLPGFWLLGKSIRRKGPELNKTAPNLTPRSGLLTFHILPRMRRVLRTILAQLRRALRAIFDEYIFNFKHIYHRLADFKYTLLLRNRFVRQPDRKSGSLAFFRGNLDGASMLFDALAGDQ